MILDIDYQKTVDAFIALGFEDFDQHYTQAKQSGIFDALEIGQMNEDEFVAAMKKYLPETVSDQQIIDAWNALLLPWKKDRIDFILELQSRYNLYLFSNTNAIHKAHFDRTFQEKIGKYSLDDLFIKAYYSHIFGKRKPHPESFEALLKENNLNPEETLFVDDSIQHVEGARKAGIHAIHLVGTDIRDLKL